jgi:hypothetical protein
MPKGNAAGMRIVSGFVPAFRMGGKEERYAMNVTPAIWEAVSTL